MKSLTQVRLLYISFSRIMVGVIVITELLVCLNNTNFLVLSFVCLNVFLLFLSLFVFASYSAFGLFSKHANKYRIQLISSSSSSSSSSGKSYPCNRPWRHIGL
jgi:hypothetical protein